MDKKTGIVVGVGIGIAGMAYMAFKRHAGQMPKEDICYGWETELIDQHKGAMSFVDTARHAGLL